MTRRQRLDVLETNGARLRREIFVQLQREKAALEKFDKRRSWCKSLASQRAPAALARARVSCTVTNDKQWVAVARPRAQLIDDLQERVKEMQRNSSAWRTGVGARRAPPAGQARVQYLVKETRDPSVHSSSSQVRGICLTALLFVLCKYAARARAHIGPLLCVDQKIWCKGTVGVCIV